MFEKFLLISITIVPFVALLLILPSIIRKKREQFKEIKPIETETQKVESEKVQETPIVAEAPKVVEQPKKKNDFSFDNDFSSDDFKDFIKSKKDKVSSPKFKFPKEEHLLDPIEHFRRPRPNKEPKTLTEEFQSLSPRMKALIMSGAFDRKDFE